MPQEIHHAADFKALILCWPLCPQHQSEHPICSGRHEL